MFEISNSLKKLGLPQGRCLAYDTLSRNHFFLPVFCSDGVVCEISKKEYEGLHIINDTPQIVSSSPITCAECPRNRIK